MQLAVVLYQNRTCNKQGSPEMNMHYHEEDYSASLLASCDSSVIEPWLNVKLLQDTSSAEAYK